MADKIVNERDAIFAEEAFVVDVQILLHTIMEEKGFSRADLARALNVSRARITQIFSDECKNLTVRLLARAMHSMGEKPTLTCELQLDDLRAKWEHELRKSIKVAPNVVPIWVDETAEMAGGNLNVGHFWNDGVNEMEFEWSANDNGRAGIFRHYGAAA